MLRLLRAVRSWLVLISAVIVAVPGFAADPASEYVRATDRIIVRLKGGALVGDVNATRSVTASDILRAKGRMGQAANSASYLYDVDTNGTINAPDIDAIRQRAGLAIP